MTGSPDLWLQENTFQVLKTAFFWLALILVVAAGPGTARLAAQQPGNDYFQEMMEAGKRQMVFGSRESAHRRVEAARVWKAPEEVLANFPEHPGFDDKNGFHVLRAALLKQAGKYEKLGRALEKISFPVDDKNLRLLHRYRLLPVTFLGPEATVKYLRRDQAGRLEVLAATGSDSVYRDYLLGRLYRRTGRLEQSLAPLASVRQRSQVGSVPWLEASFYRVGALFELERYGAAERLLEETASTYREHVKSSSEAEQRFVEVEGQWTVGQPLKDYLDDWLEAIKAGENQRWYEILGRAKEAVPYFRFFNSGYGNEPLGRLVAGRLREATGADFGAVNHKGIRAGLRKGPVRRNDLRLVLPWANEVRTAVLVKPDTVAADTLVEQLNKPLKKMVDEMFFRARYSLGTGDPLSFSAGVSYSNEMISQPKFPAGLEDSVTLAAGSYVLDRTSESPSGVLEKQAGTTFPRTDREILVQYLKREKKIEPAVVAGARGELPEVPFSSLDSAQAASEFSLGREQIIVNVQNFVVFIIGVAILVSLIRHWGEVKNYLRSGLYLGIGYSLVNLAVIPLVLSSIDFGDSPVMFTQGIFYLFLGVGAVISFFQVVLLVSAASHYTNSLGLPALPLLRPGESAVQVETDKAVTAGLGLAAFALAYSILLFLLTNPALSETIQQFRQFAFLDVRAQSSLFLLANLVLIAFMEELVYRFGVQNFLAYALKLGRDKYWLAIGISAGLWSLAHLAQLDPTWVKLLQIFPFGVALGYLYRRYGLEACVLSHGAFNVAIIYLEPYLIG